MKKFPDSGRFQATVTVDDIDTYVFKDLYDAVMKGAAIPNDVLNRTTDSIHIQETNIKRIRWFFDNLSAGMGLMELIHWEKDNESKVSYRGRILSINDDAYTSEADTHTYRFCVIDLSPYKPETTSMEHIIKASFKDCIYVDDTCVFVKGEHGVHKMYKTFDMLDMDYIG